MHVLWCRSHLVWLFFEGSIPTCAGFHSENFFVTCSIFCSVMSERGKTQERREGPHPPNALFICLLLYSVVYFAQSCQTLRDTFVVRVVPQVCWHLLLLCYVVFYSIKPGSQPKVTRAKGQGFHTTCVQHRTGHNIFTRSTWPESPSYIALFWFKITGVYSFSVNYANDYLGKVHVTR